MEGQVFAFFLPVVCMLLVPPLNKCVLEALTRKFIIVENVAGLDARSLAWKHLVIKQHVNGLLVMITVRTCI